MALYSPFPYYMSQIDIQRDLSSLTLSNSTSSSLFEFQSNISSLFTHLYDGASSYTPLCFSTLAFIQPFIIDTFFSTKNGDSRLIVRDNVVNGSFTLRKASMGVKQALVDFWKPKLPNPLEFYNNYEVISINGVDAKVYFVFFFQPFRYLYILSMNLPYL
jgi:hypothetical protein